jgi:E3 ubiquitin-protein ligase synoviolin
LITSIIGTFAKYILHTIDLNRQTPWEEKSMYFFYVDLVLDFLKLISYMIFFGIVVHYYGIPLHIVRDVYMTLRSFLQRCRDLVRYRQATANMQERYPTATQEQLSMTDGICIVCREEMHLGQDQQPLTIPDTPKVLPCGHIFHFRCLRSWLERQQACPTCRRSVLQENQALNVQGPGPLPNVNPPRDIPNAGPIPPAQVPFPPIPPNGPVANQNIANPLPNVNQQNPVPQATGVIPNVVYPIILTPLGSAGQRAVDSLSDEQLSRLQGDAREQIVERLKTLEDIQAQLRGVSTQLQQLLATFPQNQDTQ